MIKLKKYIGSCCGNSFVILDCRKTKLTNQYKSEFSQKYIAEFGVDSSLFIEESRKMDVAMQIFEKDGSESESCGNGSILIGYLLGFNSGRIEMKDDTMLISRDLEKDTISMSIKPNQLKPIVINKNWLFIKIGEPHIIISVDEFEKFDLIEVGNELQNKYPEGVNVNIIKRINESNYLIKTYERGLYNITGSCGTGSLAAYIAISYLNNLSNGNAIEFSSSGGCHKVTKGNNILKLETSLNSCNYKEIL